MKMTLKGQVNFTLTDLDQYDLVYLSLGAGLQSSVLYYMACMNWPGMPTIAYAAFSDPGDEPQHTYEVLDRLIQYGKEVGGPPIHIVSKDGAKLSDSIINHTTRFAAIPGFTKMEDGSVSMLRRQCTPDYKIVPLQVFSKRYIGIESGQHMKSRKILSLQGITTDEATRMKPPHEKWADSGYPLCTMRMSRYDCALWLEKHGLPAIDKSACVYCPFHSNSEWRQIKSVAEDWELACKVDSAIRNSTKSGDLRPVYLHRSCVPLDQVALDQDNNDLFAAECDGYCGL